MPKNRVEVIPFKDPKLGRHISHDARSARYIITQPIIKPVLQNVRWEYLASQHLNQYNVGACTGFALAQALNSAPNKPLRKLTNEDALKVYEKATQLDTFPGTYKPDDTGSSGLAACKAGQALGFVSRYEWAFGFNQGLQAVQRAPLMIGTRWYTGQYHPNSYAHVEVAGNLAGGHQYLWVGIELVPPYSEQSNLCWFLNSWGTSFGNNGYFSMSFADTRKLIEDSGDLVRPYPL